MINRWFIILAAFIIVLMIAWATYKAIRDTEPEKRRKAIYVYTGVYLGAILIYALLSTVGQGLMNDIFYWFGGKTNVIMQ